VQVQDTGNTFGLRRGKKPGNERFVGKADGGRIAEATIPLQRLDDEGVCGMVRLNSEAQVQTTRSRVIRMSWRFRKQDATRLLGKQFL